MRKKCKQSKKTKRKILRELVTKNIIKGKSMKRLSPIVKQYFITKGD